MMPWSDGYRKLPMHWPHFLQEFHSKVRGVVSINIYKDTIVYRSLISIIFKGKKFTAIDIGLQFVQNESDHIKSFRISRNGYQSLIAR